jgi:hypothetical protein
VKGAHNPLDYVGILGKTFVTNEHGTLLEIGPQKYTRWTLGRLGCPHPMAAIKLNRVCRELGVRTLAQLAKAAPQIGKYKGLGVTVYWIVLAILDEAGYDPVTVHGDEVTYSTMKSRAMKAEKGKQPRLRKRHAGPPSESAEANA